jgi:hypothetical protein
MTTADALRLWQATGPIATWDEQNGSPLLAWLAGPGTVLQVLDDLCRDTPTGPGWSQVLDVTRCPTYALPWLGQFVGVRLPPTLADAAMRAAITAELGFGRGTVAALHTAAKPYLKPGGDIIVIERTPDAYSLTVQVDPGDLIGLTYAELAARYPTYDDVAAAFATYDDFTSSEDQLIAALHAAKPAGLRLTLVVVERDVIDGGAPSPAEPDIYDARDISFPVTDFIDGGGP